MPIVTCSGLMSKPLIKWQRAFGLGMGVMEVCGALTGGFMLAGAKCSAGTDAPGTTKGKTYQVTRAMWQGFAAQNGTVYCRELKGVQTGTVLRPCPDCIRDGCALVEKMLLK